MPLYEYKCCKCPKTREVREAYDSKEIQICTCGASMTRTVSSPAFHLKGSGWAKDLYGGGE